jgi:hypothetical protein
MFATLLRRHVISSISARSVSEGGPRLRFGLMRIFHAAEIGRARPRTSTPQRHGANLSSFFVKIDLKNIFKNQHLLPRQNAYRRRWAFLLRPPCVMQGVDHCFCPFLEEPAMLTSSVRKLVRKIWGSSAMAIPPRPSMRLWLEALEDRTMPSASSVFEASPPGCGHQFVHELDGGAEGTSNRRHRAICEQRLEHAGPRDVSGSAFAIGPHPGHSSQQPSAAVQHHCDAVRQRNSKELCQRFG